MNLSLLSARVGWLLAALLAVAVLASMGGIVRGGSLDPSGPPASTAPTLDDLPGAWDRHLSSTGSDPCNTERFRCVGDGTAVLDRETGLVWIRTPFTGPGNVSWTGALDVCVGALTEGRKGWRLPTVSEFRSLIDPSQASPALPAGHPFNLSTLADASFWTSTTNVQAGGSAQAWAISMSNGVASLDLKGNAKRLWCVRGGSKFE